MLIPLAIAPCQNRPWTGAIYYESMNGPTVADSWINAVYYLAGLQRSRITNHDKKLSCHSKSF